MPNRNIWILIALLATPEFVGAQWLNHPTPAFRERRTAKRTLQRGHPAQPTEDPTLHFEGQ